MRARDLALVLVLLRVRKCVVILGLELGMAGNPHERLVLVFDCGYGDIVSLTTAVATCAELFPCCVPIENVIDNLYVRSCDV